MQLWRMVLIESVVVPAAEAASLIPIGILVAPGICSVVLHRRRKRPESTVGTSLIVAGVRIDPVARPRIHARLPRSHRWRMVFSPRSPSRNGRVTAEVPRT